MPFEIDPVTGKRTLTYTSSEQVRTYTKKGPFSGILGNPITALVNPSTYTSLLAGNDLLSSYKSDSSGSWDASAIGKAITDKSAVLGIISDDQNMQALLESQGGQKLREMNTEFASYYQAYMAEENQRRNIAKAFGVQNTVLTGAGTITGAEASKKGTALGGGI